MDPRFVNDTRVDYNLYLEAMRVHHRYAKPVRRVVSICVAVLCVLLSVYYVWARSYIAALLFLLYGAVMAFIFFAGHLVYAKRGYRNMQAIHRDGAHVYFLYEDRITAETENGSTTFTYDRFTHALLGERAVLLLIGNAFMVLDRAGFRGNTEREALAFLHERCTKAKFAP